MYDYVLGETAERNINQIDRMIELFGINAQELNRYIIFLEEDKSVLAKVNEDGTKTIVTSNPKTIKVIESLITIKLELNDALREEVISGEEKPIIRKL